jgi:hypothetical protein
MNGPQTSERAGRRELDLLIAGHTNTGKTSLIRTLGRAVEFGEVSPAPSTTRRVEPFVLLETDELMVRVYDSPGLESASRLRELLDDTREERYDIPARIRRIVGDVGMNREFEQELRVLAQALEVDAVLYVVDAREPVLEKYLDEIVLLAMCGKPVLPVLNFVAWPRSREPDWRAELAKLGQHTVVAFDAVVYTWVSERRLYRSLATVLPDAEQAIERLSAIRESQAHWRRETATRLLADALIDIAACEETCDRDDTRAMRDAGRRVRQFTHRREADLTKEVLAAFSYTPEILGERPHEDLDAAGWMSDAFDRATLERYGIASVGPVAAGAATGGVVDVLTLGGTLGLGMLVGAAAGLAWSTRDLARRLYRTAVQRRATLVVDPAVFSLIAMRHLELIATLEARGHAEQRPAEVPDQPGGRFPVGNELMKAFYRARQRPEWSAYNDDADPAGRERAVHGLARSLSRLLDAYRDASSRDLSPVAITASRPRP